MSKQMWMGTRGFERWVPAPAINMDRGRKGFSSETTTLRGGLDVQRSKAGHGEWAMTWPTGSLSALAVIEAMASGVYDTVANKGHIYFIDPMAAYTNAMPQDWASPGIADTIALANVEPTYIDQANSAFDYPARSARYAIGAGFVSRKAYIPIPPGHRLVIGATGSGTAFVRVTPFAGATAQTPTNLTWLSRTTSQLTSHSFGGGTITGVEVSLFGTSGQSMDLNAIVARILPGTPNAVQNGSFMPGRGAGGCTFVGPVGESALSAALDLSQFSARLVEVEAWS